MTTENVLTDRQAIRLCKDVDRLVLIRESLEQLYQQHPDRLTRAFEKHPHRSSMLSTQAVLDDSLDTGRTEFRIVDFLNQRKRVKKFEILFGNIDDICLQTALISECYNRATDKFDYRMYDLVPNKNRTFDFDYIIQKIEYYIKFSGDLRKVLIRD